jgi:uncharacterized membrane protein (UPF0127 family)
MSRGALLAVALATACPSRSTPPGSSGTSAPSPSAARAKVHTAKGVAVVTLEVARTQAAHERGLMGRSELAPDAGMLFVFDQSSPHGFWMKNTLIPLDMLFLGDDGRVLSVVERKPLTEDVTDGGVASRYVLEVNGGWARAHGLARGDQVTLENVLY